MPLMLPLLYTIQNIPYKFNHVISGNDAGLSLYQKSNNHSHMLFVNTDYMKNVLKFKKALKYLISLNYCYIINNNIN